MNRQEFLKNIGMGSLAMALAPNMLMAETFPSIGLQSDQKLTILHTND